MPDPLPLPADAPAAGTERPATVEEVIRALAKQHGVSPALALAVAQKESSLNPAAQGDFDASGKPLALGTFQLHTGAAKDTGTVDRADPLQNITGGIKYLRDLSDRYNGDVNKILMAYNGGSKWVDAGTPSPAAQAYAAEVMANVARTARGAATGGVQPPAGVPAPRMAGRGTAATNIGTAASENVSSFLTTMKEQYDPTTPTGRENLVGQGAALGSALLTRGLPLTSFVARATQVLAPIVAAGLGGSLERATEEAGGRVPSEPNSIQSAGLRQAGYETVGQTVAWPFRHFGRTLVAGKVATVADAALTDAQRAAKAAGQADVAAARAAGAADVAHVTATGKQTVEQVQTQLNQTLSLLREAQQGAMDAVKADVGMAVSHAATRASDRLADAELANVAELAAAKKPFDDLLRAAPSIGQTAKDVKTTLEGPAKRALDAAGQAVATAADQGTKAGLMVQLKPVQDALRTMAGRVRDNPLVRPVVTAAEKAEAEKNQSILMKIQGAYMRSQTVQGPPRADAIVQFNQDVAQWLGIDPTKMHPELPGLLGKFMSAEGPVTFTEAHQMKMLLDEAVTWDRPAKKHLERLTKGLRGALREAMTAAGNTAYEHATGVYANLAPLYRRDIGRKLITLSQSPAGSSRVAQLLKDSDPISADTIRRLLVDQAAAGGDAQLGQRAWDGVRSAYVYDHLITKGADKLGENLDKLLTTRPEFVRTVFGDASGQQVLTNLSKIADAIKAAETIAAERSVAAKALGQAETAEVGAVGKFAEQSVRRENVAAKEAATRAGQTRVANAKEAAATATAAAKDRAAAGITAATAKATAANEAATGAVEQFNRSSLQPFINYPPLKSGTDAARLMALGLGSYWGILSGLRLLKSPRGADLVHYAALSPRGTQLLVDLLTKPGPPQAASALVRDLGSAFLSPQPAHATSAATSAPPSP